MEMSISTVLAINCSQEAKLIATAKKLSKQNSDFIEMS